MRRLAQIWAIVRKDLMESLRNKTILIVLLLPLFASLMFTALSGIEGERNFSIGIIEEQKELAGFLRQRVINITADSFEGVEQGRLALRQGKIDGLVVRKDTSFRVYINSQRSLNYFVLKDNLRNVIQEFMQVKPRLELEFIPVNTSRAARGLLPTWLTISMAMIGILIISGNFAEEKENHTLDAIRVSPIFRLDILLGKGVFGILLSIITAGIMLVVNGVFLATGQSLALGLLITAGAVVFTALGLLIGVLVSSQSSARAAGTVIYFPMLFPAFIYDLSPFTEKLAHFFPTFYLYRGLERLLLYQGEAGTVTLDLLVLTVFSVVLIALEFYLFTGVMGNDY